MKPAKAMTADTQPDRLWLQQGRNCGQIAPCDHASLLIDAARYFRVLKEMFEQARQSILIIGWDFDGAICLNGQPGEKSERLGALLHRLAEEKPELDIRILIWSLSVLHSPGDPYAKLFGDKWQKHPRISFRLDRQHPFYACHHQKIVVVDDSIAFVGGIDLTVGRRDRRGHHFAALRRNPDGHAYGPVHDLQLMVDGPAAKAVGEMARKRWKAATGEALKAPAPRRVWPSNSQADFNETMIGISCTSPPWHGRPAVCDGVQLAKDMLRGARRTIYIEAQYFTAPFLADILCPALEAPSGPEIVLVLSGHWVSGIERLIFAGNRNRLLRRLKRADRHGRLAAYYPVVPGKDGPMTVLVHAKLIIADDGVLRIGSSNLNNRSTGLDAECDLAIEARSRQDSAAIAELRGRLVAEHLGVETAALSRAVEAHQSLIGAIAALDPDHRRLVPFTVTEEGPLAPVFGTGLVDPARPWRLPGWLWRRGVAARNANSARSKTITPKTSGSR